MDKPYFIGKHPVSVVLCLTRVSPICGSSIRRLVVLSVHRLVEPNVFFQSMYVCVSSYSGSRVCGSLPVALPFLLEEENFPTYC